MNKNLAFIFSYLYVIIIGTIYLNLFKEIQDCNYKSIIDFMIFFTIIKFIIFPWLFVAQDNFLKSACLIVYCIQISCGIIILIMISHDQFNQCSVKITSFLWVMLTSTIIILSIFSVFFVFGIGFTLCLPVLICIYVFVYDSNQELLILQ